jgi:IS30 family transposase
MNGLIRQYFPKKSSFENITDDDIKRVQDKLNTLPRKKHNFSLPIEFLNYKFGLAKVAFAA